MKIKKKVGFLVYNGEVSGAEVEGRIEEDKADAGEADKADAGEAGGPDESGSEGPTNACGEEEDPEAHDQGAEGEEGRHPQRGDEDGYP